MTRLRYPIGDGSQFFDGGSTRRIVLATVGGSASSPGPHGATGEVVERRCGVVRLAGCETSANAPPQCATLSAAGAAVMGMTSRTGRILEELHEDRCGAIAPE